MPDPVYVRAYVGLGANLGDTVHAVLDAMTALGQLPQTRVRARSRLYRSAPMDAGGPDFINAVVALDTALSADELLTHLQALEEAAGRTRPYRHAPRTLDLDLLLYGVQHSESPTLTLPHPRMQRRAFVLLPLHDVAPECVSDAALRAVAAQICTPIRSADPEVRGA